MTLLKKVGIAWQEDQSDRSDLNDFFIKEIENNKIV